MGEFIEVSVTFIPTAQGGRVQLPVGAGYCPHFVVPGDDVWLGVRFRDLPNDTKFGDPCTVRVELLYSPNLDYSVLSVGTEFQVKEGLKTVAVGVVLRDTG